MNDSVCMHVYNTFSNLFYPWLNCPSNPASAFFFFFYFRHRLVSPSCSFLACLKSGRKKRGEDCKAGSASRRPRQLLFLHSGKSSRGNPICLFATASKLLSSTPTPSSPPPVSDHHVDSDRVHHGRSRFINFYVVFNRETFYDIILFVFLIRTYLVPTKYFRICITSFFPPAEIINNLFKFLLSLWRSH